MVLFVVLHVWVLYKCHKLANENNRKCGIIEDSRKEEDDNPLIVRLLIALNPCKNEQRDIEELDCVEHDLCIKFRDTLENQPYVLNLQKMKIKCDEETNSIVIYDKNDILQYAITEWKFLSQTHEHNVWIDVDQSEFGKDPILRLGIKCRNASSADHWRRRLQR